jgi:hypothetical protein
MGVDHCASQSVFASPCPPSPNGRAVGLTNVFATKSKPSKLKPRRVGLRNLSAHSSLPITSAGGDIVSCSDAREGGTELAIIALTVDCMTVGRSMYSSAEFCRRRGLVAKQRAAHCTDLSLKEAFNDVARHWLALAERIDWLDRQHNGQQNPITYRTSRTRCHVEEPLRVIDRTSAEGGPRKSTDQTTDGLQTNVAKPPARPQRNKNGPTCSPGRNSGTS